MRHYSSIIIALAAVLASSCCERPQEVKPPLMGWSSWNAYMVDISDSIITHQADLMVEKGLKEALSGIPVQVNRVGSLLTVFFTDKPVTGYDAARSSDLERFRRWYLGLLMQGIYAAPSQFEAMFLCNAHTDEEIERIVACAGKIF